MHKNMLQMSFYGAFRVVHIIFSIFYRCSGLNISMHIPQEEGMLVGITCFIEYSVFSSGNTNTCIALVELMKALGHEVVLLNLKEGGADWWDDCHGIHKIANVVSLAKVKDPFDLVFEVGTNTLTKEFRAQFAKKSIWIIRKHFVLSEIENSIFFMQMAPRNMEGIVEAWLMNDVTSPDDVSVLETYTRVPVRQVSFLWTPLLAEAHLRSIGSPRWKMSENGTFIVHIADTNTTNSSNSTIPLVILHEAKRNKFPVDTWFLHNGENIAKTRFFKENVLKHCEHADLSGACVGRQRAVEWALQPGSLALIHLRFRNLRPILLDLAWAGVPVIHNSTIFMNAVEHDMNLFYSNNSVSEAVNVMKRGMHPNWLSAHDQRRERILHKWAPISPAIRREWGGLLAHHIVVTSPLRNNPPIVMVAGGEECTIKNVLFTDMEHVAQGMSCSFQGDYNFFTLLLNTAGKQMSPAYSVVGWNMQTWDMSQQPDLIVFGPFGRDWMKFPINIPKVHFTGENSPPIQREDVVLNMGYQHNYMIKDSYIRFPLWMMEIDWFQADVERLVNPKPIPLQLCTQTYENTLESRQKFCSFIVSNPSNPIRNQAFHSLNQYKPVDSGGGLFNTIGNELAAGLGGGGGELKKTKFMMKYKFAITYENSKSMGYCTEKYLHAKAAGTIPIYWGDPEFQRDFDTAGCIDARNFTTPDELIRAVKEVDMNDQLWRQMASTPALDEYRVDLVRRTLAECANRLYKHMGVPDAALKTIPRFLGCAAGSPESKQGMEYFQMQELATTTIRSRSPELPVVATYVTFSFLGSLQHWLSALKAQMQVLPNLKAIVFMGPDIKENVRTNLFETYPFASFEYVPADWTPPNFPDFWEPTHYGWKLWIYHTLVKRESLQGSMILYMDAGSVLCRWPTAWIGQAAEHGICFLEDPREENDRWCGDLFCSHLKVTDEERAMKQIVAGILCFRSGHPAATKLFEEAFALAQDKDILVGPRISGVGADGKPYGHRQDQSILSILMRRHALPTYPLDKVYGDHSMRKTFQEGRAIYVHRGNFNNSIDFLPGISDSFVINLDRRKDRLDKLYTNHPELQGRVQRISAFDGKTLALTPELTQLFKPNDFFWKRAVMGCALSHLSVWWKLVNDHADIKNYLILEDDVKFHPGWEDVVSKSMPHAPEDYDVLYLGGILPPNRDMFEKLLEPVTKYYSRIKPHTFFGQEKPSPYFHSCAYSYILSRQGALKIMKALEQHRGYWTSADHIMCSPCDTMNLYFLRPMIAGCFQDDDPSYANSDFNNFSRVDSFDSDLWNNDERFDMSTTGTIQTTYDINTLLRSIFEGKILETKIAPVNNVISGKYGILDTEFVCVKGVSTDFTHLYESSWLCSLMGNLTNVQMRIVDETSIMNKMPIMILTRPYVKEATQIMKVWNEKGIRFKILHMADEFTNPLHRDSLVCYSFPKCISILRFYMRSDFPPGTESKIKIIPLGYHWSKLLLEHPPLSKTPQLPFREIHWSFYGTNWQNRAEEMKPLIEMKVNKLYKFYESWNHPENLSKTEYMDILLNSIFVPCPVGQNAETFRFYEALEAGCIPLVIRSPVNEDWFQWVSKYIPLVSLSTWDEAAKIMYSLLSRPEALEIYRKKILNGWSQWTHELKKQATDWIRMV
jgi:GR25 family glycosyltransferase involved in LPS biosynthesis